MTYEFNRLYDRPADSSNIFSPTQIFNFLNGGDGWYGVSTFDSWNVVKSQGNMTISDYFKLPYIYEDKDKAIKYRGQYWENGYEKYYQGMKNRISNYYSLNVETDEDLRILKHFFNDHLKSDDYGGTAIFYSNSYFFYHTQPIGFILDTINNFSPYYLSIFDDITGEPTHSMTLVGYYHNNLIDFNEDGVISDNIDTNSDGVIDMHDNEQTLWIVVNSDYGHITRNLFFLKYDVLSQVWNDQVFIPVPDTAYAPELTLKIKMKHPNRKDIKISAGISSDLQSEYPEQIIDFLIWNYQGGEHVMTGVDTMPDSETLEFGIDVTDLKKLKNGSGLFNIFMKIENSGIDEGELQYFSIIDYTGAQLNEHVIVDNPVELLPISDNYFNDIFNFSLNKSESILDITSPTVITGKTNEQVFATINPIDGQEPYNFYIAQNNEYSVNLSTIDFASSTTYMFNTSIVSTSNPKIVNPEWDILFNGKTYDSIAIEQSGTIAIDSIIKFSSQYPYQTLVKGNKYLQINPYNITEYSRKYTSAFCRIRDTAIMILKKDCTFDEWNSYDCDEDYLLKIYPDGRIRFTYSDHIPQNKIFANIKTHTKTYYIPYEQSIADTFNTVTFTPNPVDSLFSIDENGVLTMQPVSEPGVYETYVLVRDANGQEFTKRIEVNVITENIIGQLYPNPTNDVLYCDIYNPIEQNAIIEIYTIAGQLVYKDASILNAGITNYSFDTKQFRQGVYLLKISIGDKSQTQRFVTTK
jgi:hypothetical protein